MIQPVITMVAACVCGGGRFHLSRGGDLFLRGGLRRLDLSLDLDRGRRIGDRSRPRCKMENGALMTMSQSVRAEKAKIEDDESRASTRERPRFHS